MSTLVNTTDAERRIAERVDTAVTANLSFTSSSGGLSFSSASEAMEFAKLMALSQIGVRKHLRGNPGACLAIVVQAVEWRMSPYAVANKSYMVNDQIAYESQLIQAVILQRAPIKGRFKVTYSGAGDKRTCTVQATLTDCDTVDYTSPEFGKINPKNSPLWKTDPDQQLFYFSGRNLCRRHFPDVLLGVYAEDEIAPMAEVARDVSPIKDLAARMDALAAPRGTDEDHDPETGEITAAPSGPQTGEAQALPSPARAEPQPPEASTSRAPSKAAALDGPSGGDPIDDFPGDRAPPHSEAVGGFGSDVSIDSAYREGEQAKREGKARRSLPEKYRDEDACAEAGAWENGFDDEAEKMKGGA